MPVQSTQELIAYARANPGKLNFGSGGAGSTSHLAMALFNSMTNTQMAHVPYRGSTPVVSELIAGNLHLAMSSMSTRCSARMATRSRANSACGSCRKFPAGWW